MKRHAFIVTAAASIIFAGQALAQTIVVAPEQRTTIKTYVEKKKILGVTVKEKMSVGATVPTEVALAPAPEDWGPSVSKYHYVYSDNNVYLVEPQSRKIVTIVD